MMKNKAFTLIEIMVVVIILGILAVLALPKNAGSVDTAKFSEAVQATRTLYAAQKRYALDHNNVCSASCAALDVSITLQYHTATCKTNCSVILQFPGVYAVTAAPSTGVLTCFNLGSNTKCSFFIKYLGN